MYNHYRAECIIVKTFFTSPQCHGTWIEKHLIHISFSVCFQWIHMETKSDEGQQLEVMWREKKTYTCVFFIKRYTDSALNSYNPVRLTMDILKHGSNSMQQNHRSHPFFPQKLVVFFLQKTGTLHHTQCNSSDIHCYAIAMLC